MQSINVETWEEFEEELRDREIAAGGGYLFRGQKNACWELDTTLERKSLRFMFFPDYYRLISVVRAQVETFTGHAWGDLPTYQQMLEAAGDYDGFNLTIGGFGPFPAYSYMAYLRHHNFPSPLLDWSTTPFVAAYFAFRNATAERVAIYVYSERPAGFKGYSSHKAQIRPLGHYVKTHRRHFLQQSEYTICWNFQQGVGWHFAPHASVFSLDDPHQDALWKFTIPATERVKVLKLLDAHNLNAFSPFDSEEALMETLAIRHIDFKEPPETTSPTT